MTLTISLMELSIFIIAITFFILVIYLIPAIIQLRQTARSIEELSELAKKQVKGLEGVINGFGQLKTPLAALAGLISFIWSGIGKLRKEGEDDVRK